jgi:ribosomal protein S17E
LVPGYVAVKRFDEGVKETINYILAHPEYQTEDEAFDSWCDAVIETLQIASKKIKNNSL